MKIGCVILAGGKSSRMGQDKAFLEINGKSFLKQLTETLDFFDEKMISRNNGENIHFPSWQLAEDLYKNHGPIGGLHSCLSRCKSDALFFVSCDMPLIGKSLIETMCSELIEDIDAVVLRENDGKVHPTCAIYKKNMSDIFEKQILSNNNRLMLALEKMNVKYVVMNSSQQLSNINTPEDYLAMKKIK